jgi:hypothetical protein
MKPATQLVHWPGKDIPACDEHAVRIVQLAAAMGFVVSSTPCTDDLMCLNCVHGVLKDAADLARGER